MTRSTLTVLRAPALMLLVLSLAAVGCGGGGDATADPTTIPAATDGGPAGPDATMAVVAAAARTEATLPSASGDTTGAPANPTALDPTTAITGTTIPSTTIRPTSASTAPASSGTTASTAPASSGTTGTTLMTKPSGQPAGIRLAGTVTASPTCPVERPDQPCPPRPVAAAHVEVFDRGEHLVTTVDTDSQGGFVLVLPAGRYVLATSSGTIFPSCPRITVEVPAADDARAEILCDSGLR